MKEKEYTYKFGNAHYYGRMPFYLSFIFINIFCLVNIYFIFPIVLLIIVDYFAFKYIRRNFYIFKTRKYIINHLNFFLSYNNIVNYKTYRKYLVFKRYVVGYQPIIKYSFNNDEIKIRVLLDGSLKSKQLSDCGEELEHLFSMPLKDIIKTQGEITYIFEVCPAERLIVSSIEDFGNYAYGSNSNSIRLNSNLVWNIDKTPHALITGGTGAGKTFFIIYLIYAFKNLEADIFLLDPKRSDLSSMGNLVGDDNIAYEPNHIARVLREANDLMNNRYDEMRKLNTNKEIGKIYSDFGMKPTVLFFDEVMAFMSIADNKLAKECNGYLTSIIAKGRQAGVFFVFSTQRADTDFISGAIRDQLGLRLALGSNSNEGYRMVFGSLEKELNKLSSSNGQGYIYLADGKMSQPCFYETPLIESGVI